jgi:hypothetical protein
MDSGIAAGIDMMGSGNINQKTSQMMTIGATIPAVKRLNELFDCRWCWAIVDSGMSPKNDVYILQGRLFIGGYGFRDGVGISSNSLDASQLALINAMEMFGLHLVAATS